MELVAKNSELTARLAPVIAGVVAERAPVCAKVIDRSGEVVAVNRHGLAMLGREADEVCGAPWLGLWTGEAADEARRVVEAAFGGDSARFTGRMQLGARARTWEVEALPLPDTAGQVETILILSRAISDAPDAEALQDTLRDALHAFGNVANSAASGARLIRRGVPEAMAEQLADELETAAERAGAALDELRALTGSARESD